MNPHNIVIPHEYNSFKQNELPRRIVDFYLQRNQMIPVLDRKILEYYNKLNNMNKPKNRRCGVRTPLKTKYHPNCGSNVRQQEIKLKRLKEHLIKWQKIKLDDINTFFKKTIFEPRTPEERWWNDHFYLKKEDRSYYVMYGESNRSSHPRIAPLEYIEENQQILEDMHREMKSNQHKIDDFMELMLKIKIFDKIQIIPNQSILEERLNQLSLPENIERLQSILIHGIIPDYENTQTLSDIEFLLHYHIIDPKLVQERNIILGTNKILFKKYFSLSWSYNVQFRVKMILDILQIPNMSEKIHMLIFKMKLELVLIIYQYVFYTNYFIEDRRRIPEGKTLDYMFRWIYEYIFYGNLNYHLHFIRVFLNTQDKEISTPNLGAGNTGIVTSEGGIATKRIPYIYFEKTIFEFFKHLILYDIQPENIPRLDSFYIGDKFLYINMEAVEGPTYLQYMNSESFTILNQNTQIRKLNQLTRHLIPLLIELQEKCHFIHLDLNLGNIMLTNTSEEINYRNITQNKLHLIDFEKLILQKDGMYYFTYQRYLKFEDIFMNEHPNFWKSIDLFRYFLNFERFQGSSIRRVLKISNNELSRENMNINKKSQLNAFKERVPNIIPPIYLQKMNEVFFGIHGIRFDELLMNKVFIHHSRKGNKRIFPKYLHYITFDYEFRKESFDILKGIRPPPNSGFTSYLLDGTTFESWINHFIPGNSIKLLSQLLR